MHVHISQGPLEEQNWHDGYISINLLNQLIQQLSSIWEAGNAVRPNLLQKIWCSSRASGHDESLEILFLTSAKESAEQGQLTWKTKPAKVNNPLCCARFYMGSYQVVPPTFWGGSPHFS